MPNASETLIGEICTFGFNFPPQGFAFCAGQLIAISQNTALYSLIGTFYGGDGRVSFQYPNFTSRMPVGFHMGGGIGLTPYQIGQFGGLEHITLAESQMPAHNHAAIFTPSGGGSGATGSLKVLNSGAATSTPATGGWIAGGNAIAFSDTKLPFQQEVEISGLTISGGSSGGGTVTVGNTGASASHENRPPFQAINFSICEDGLYPSRN